MPSLTLQRGKYRTVPGVSYGTPKEVWRFRTVPARGTPEAVARRFLRENEALLGLRGVRLKRNPRVVQSAGAHHVIFAQLFRGHPVHRGYVTVHLDRQRRVYLVKNRVVPRDIVDQVRGAHELTPSRAKRIARRVLRGARARLAILEAEPFWYPHGKDLWPAFRVRVQRKTPKTRSEEILFIHARTGRCVSRYDNLAAAPLTVALFDPNPMAAVADWRTLVGTGKKRSGTVRRAARPASGTYRTVALRDLPASGRLDGERVTTRLTARRVRVRPGFELKAHRAGFEEVMAWFHLDRAIRYIESLGYRGPRAIFDRPIPVNARGTREDNSWYSPYYRSLTFGTGGVDDAEDAETIVHEFGHALQDAICPGFGQSAEAAAMGEGFGDYLAGSVFAGRKPATLRERVMSWDAFELSEEEPPCLRRLDSELTYESFDHGTGADEHENGVIWSATLWDIWRALGRRTADRIIVESHFQLDGFTTFARGARAILDADRHRFQGAHLARLRRIFHRRGIGPVD